MCARFKFAVDPVCVNTVPSPLTTHARSAPKNLPDMDLPLALLGFSVYLSHRPLSRANTRMMLLIAAYPKRKRYSPSSPVTVRVRELQPFDRLKFAVTADDDLSVKHTRFRRASHVTPTFFKLYPLSLLTMPR